LQKTDHFFYNSFKTKSLKIDYFYINMTIIKKIAAIETYSVRLPVLRKGKPIESCHFDGDDLETTLHFGLYLGQKLVGII
jgi:hypothetical protein